MGNVFFLVAACAVLTFLLFLLAFIVLAWVKKEGPPAEVQEPGGRSDAIANLHAAREKIREARPDLAQAANQAAKEAMQLEIENAGREDPAKAAGNLQHFMK